MTPQEIIEEQFPLAFEKRPGLAAEIKAVIHWHITGDNGGDWTMDLTADKNRIRRGLQGSPAMKITISDDDFVKLRQGQLNGMNAVMTGRLRFSPMNLSLAMKVAQLMGSK